MHTQATPAKLPGRRFDGGSQAPLCRTQEARLDNPEKRWKFKKADLDERAHWDEYIEAFDDAISATSTKAAPWHVIPANKKWYRNFAVSTILLDALTCLDPKYPPPEDDLSEIKVT